MRTSLNWIWQALPILVGLGVVVLTAVATKLYIYRKRNRSPPKTLLDTTVKYPLKLIAKEEISHDTRKFTYALPTSEHVLGLPIGQHVYLTAKIDGKLVIRAYTPVTSDEDLGHVDLVIKVYFKDVHPKFPKGGAMTQHLNNMNIGDTIDFRGPNGLLIYEGHGKFQIRADKKSPPEQVNASKVSMIAGGTGLTPMLQLCKAILGEPEDTTQLRLLYANQTEDDILLREDLEGLQDTYPDKFAVWYTIDRPTEDWKYSSGFISADMISANLFPPGEESLVLMCGPPPMINFACTPALDKLGYRLESRFAY